MATAPPGPTGPTGPASVLPWEPAQWSATGPTGATGPAGTALVAAEPTPYFRLSDGLHSHQELTPTAHAGPPVRGVDVDMSTLATPLDVVAFLLAIVLAIAARQLWPRVLELVLPQNRSA